MIKELSLLSLMFIFLSNTYACTLSENDHQILKKCDDEKEILLFNNKEYSYSLFSIKGDYAHLSRIPNVSPKGVSEEHFIFRISDENIYSSPCLKGIIGLAENQEGSVDVSIDNDIHQTSPDNLNCGINLSEWRNNN